MSAGDGQILNEIVALHWTSHANGATCAEVYGSLSASGETVEIEAVGYSIERLLAEGAIRYPKPLERAPSFRDEWPVWVPCEVRP